MKDLTKTIEAKSDQLNADDLFAGSINITITELKLLAGDQPVAIHYNNDNGKPWKPCKSMRRVMVNAWGSDGNKYIGKSMTLFRDDTVKYAGQNVGGIRISHMSDIKSSFTISLTASSKSKKPYTVKLLPKGRDKAEIIKDGVKAKDVKEWGAKLSAEDKAIATANWNEIKKLRGDK